MQANTGTPTGNVDGLELISHAGRGAADALLSLSTDTGGSGGPQSGDPSAQGPAVSGTGLNGTGTGNPDGAAGGAGGSGGPGPTSGGGALGSGAAPGAAASTGLTKEDLVDALRMALEHPSGKKRSRNQFEGGNNNAANKKGSKKGNGGAGGGAANGSGNGSGGAGASGGVWIPNEEVQARKAARVCIKCGQEGHMAKGCTNPKSLTPSFANRG